MPVSVLCQGGNRLDVVAEPAAPAFKVGASKLDWLP